MEREVDLDRINRQKQLKRMIGNAEWAIKNRPSEVKLKEMASSLEEWKKELYGLLTGDKWEKINGSEIQ